MNKLNKLIQDRYSPRAFSTKKVEPQKIELLIEAARWAASSYNEQPWRFIIGEKGDENYDKIFDSLMTGNQIWNRTVPLLIQTVIKTTSSHNGKPNLKAQHDLGLAVGNLSIQATDLGLHVHQMGGFDTNAVREAFGIPEDFIPMTVIAVGYKGNLNDLPENLQKMEQAPRTRKERNQIVFAGDWIKLK